MGKGGKNMAQEVVHRCTKKCPYHKNCFVCKTKTEVLADVVVLHKCMITKEDIPIQIGIKKDACIV